MRTGYALISCEHGFEKSIMKKLKDEDGVVNVSQVSGTYDIIVKLESENQEKLRELIIWKIRKIEKIRSFISLVEKENHPVSSLR